MTATPIGDLIERMLAAGLPHASVVDTVRTMESLGIARAVTLATAWPVTSGNERSRKAINQAAYRARKLAKHGESVALAAPHAPVTRVATPGNASGNGVTSAPLSILSVLPVSASQELPKEEKKQEVEVLNSEPRAKAKRGARLPDDWTPSEIDRQYAAGRGLRLIEIEIEATKFRNYWTNRTDKLATKPRWDRAWENWILNMKGSPNGNGKSVIAAQDRLNAKISEFSEPDLLGGVRREAGATDVRLLPARRSG